ncbi:MAG: SNF2-related protein [Candidatus Muiribacteriota bacterium]
MQKYTKYHAKYYAYDLTRKKTHEGIGQIGQSIFNSSIEIKPHQIDASLFAYRSPLSKGVILADEVGLGKTIEAGLVLAQHWAERKRNILVIVPASLRKQWQNELHDKFFMPSIILETKNYNKLVKDGYNPFEQKKIIIVSPHFASKHKDEIRLKKWDIVIIDEAHKLRNIKGKIASSLLWALEESKKLMLTATPLQNNLIELFNLSKFIDDKIFGEKAFFNREYKNNNNLEDLRDILQNFCTRTLRKDVQQYINYKERIPLTIKFNPTDAEQELYRKVSDLLMKEDSYALPSGQKELITMVLRKILGSSTVALIETLKIIRDRLEKLKKDNLIIKKNDDNFWNYFAEDELLDEDEIEYFEDEDIEEDDAINEDEIDIDKLSKEIEDIDYCLNLARTINYDSKSKALLKALENGFEKLNELGANKKALIFTESVRTQKYLFDYLETRGYRGKIVLFNGSNSSQETKDIYKKWLTENTKNGRSSGSKTADTKMAVIDYFEKEAEIMIATESASEGVNLQFCSMVINYDLPWNPQRIEQRIGRCHRYGQKYDVVVINFLNRKNEAEKRVLQLLETKFHLFKGVFGSSNEVLGSIESEIDFEKAILKIFQQCRTTDEINKAFDELQKRFEIDIKHNMKKTYEKLFKYFDEDVHKRLKITQEESKRIIDDFLKKFWNLTNYILADKAIFYDDFNFELIDEISENIEPGKYFINHSKKNINSKFIYRTTHPLGEYVINKGKNVVTEVNSITFNYSKYPHKISVLEELKGQTGYLSLDFLAIDSFDREEYLLFTGFKDSGEMIEKDILEKLFLCEGEESNFSVSEDKIQKLIEESEILKNATINKSTEINNDFFKEESIRIDRWADSKVQQLTDDIKKAKNELRNINNEITKAENSQEIALLEEKKTKIRRKISRLRNERDDKEDEIEEKRMEYTQKIKKRMISKAECNNLFKIKWSII